ncbi:MAG TPA: alpha/beta fold hydrolase, partial [Thermoanaerobaculia bacterium]
FYPNHPTLEVGASWMTREDRESEIADSIEYLDAVYREAGSAPHVRVLGFSQGGATAARWFARGSSRIDHLILWGCAFPNDVDLEPARERFARARVHSVIGSHDGFVSELELQSQTERFTRAAIDLELVRFEGGHRIDAEVLRRVTAAPHP